VITEGMLLIKDYAKCTMKLFFFIIPLMNTQTKRFKWRWKYNQFRSV